MFSLSLGRKARDAEIPKVLDEERKPDCDLGGCGYNFTDSIAVALDFSFRARLGQLPGIQQRLISIDQSWASVLCEQILPGPIRIESSCRSRIIYFGQWCNNDTLFRVIVLRGQGRDEWRVVGFHYPRDEKGSYYSVFEPHEYWFGWRTKSGYLSMLVNLDY